MASRREIERWIAEGRVKLNGQLLTTPATLVTAQDSILVDGRPVQAAESTRLWRYHKPLGLLVTRFDPEGRPTIYDQLPPAMANLITVGRLDLNSEGLLLLTNDGALARHLEHPDSGYSRVYRVRAFGLLDPSALAELERGAVVDGIAYAPAMVDILRGAPGWQQGGIGNHWLQITLTEGKNREVRRLLAACGLAVNRLIRTHYGSYSLDNLPIGAVEEIGYSRFNL